MYLHRTASRSSTDFRCVVENDHISAEKKLRFASQVLRSDRKTSSLITHLKKQHEINAKSPVPSSKRPQSSPQSASKKARMGKGKSELPRQSCQEEEESSSDVGEEAVIAPLKKKIEVQIQAFLHSTHNLKYEMLSLICESNLSINQVETSESLRRILTRAYPHDPPPPRSISTVRKLLKEELAKVRDAVRLKVKEVREKSMNSP